MNARLWAALLVLVPLAACDGKDPTFWQKPNQLLPTVALDDRVAFVEVNSHTAFLLDPGQPTLTPVGVAVNATPVMATKRNGKNELLVLSRGVPASATVTGIPARLEDIDAATGTLIHAYTLTSRFDGFAQSPDGNFAILYHANTKPTSEDDALYNPNQIAILDFTSATITERPIRSLGSSPSGIVFSPALNFHGGSRTLAVILADSYVTVLDLGNPGRNEISVPLCPQTSASCSYTPAQLAFGPNPVPEVDPAKDQATPRVFNAFVRMTSATDIVQLTLTELLPGKDVVPPPPSNDFLATISMLGVGSRAADMAVIDTRTATTPLDVKNTTRVVVAAPDARSLVYIDPTTTAATTVDTTSAVSTILPYSPPGNPGAKKALLLDLTGGSRTAIYADLDTIETKGSQALIERPVSSPPSRADLLAQEGIVLLTCNASGTALVVVDLERRSSASVIGNAQLKSVTLDSHAPSRLWGAVSGTKLTAVSLLAASSFAEVWLDQAITSITPLASPSSDGIRHLVIGHSDPGTIGNITVLNADSPDRATARTAQGFLLSNYVERGQP